MLELLPEVAIECISVCIFYIHALIGGLLTYCWRLVDYKRVRDTFPWPSKLVRERRPSQLEVQEVETNVSETSELAAHKHISV